MSGVRLLRSNLSRIYQKTRTLGYPNIKLDERDEWYREPCIKCSGECDVPTTAPYRAEERDAEELEPELLKYLENPMSFSARPNTPTNLYAKHLASFYLLFLSLRFLPFRDECMGWMDNGRLHQNAWLSSMATAMKEMHCRADVMHHRLYIHLTDEEPCGDDDDDDIPDVCDCLVGRRPQFANVGLDLRTSIAEELVHCLVEAPNTGRPVFSLGEKIGLQFLQKAVFEGIKGIPTKQGSLAPSDARFIDLIIPMSKQDYHRRETAIRPIVEKTKGLLPGSMNSRRGLGSIMSLVKSLVPFLALDRGLSIARAGRILRWLAAGLLVQVQRPDWGKIPALRRRNGRVVGRGPQHGQTCSTRIFG
ncbi:hypothetical protein B0H67DRAFT_57727 [Lasiosphaeris hirsuta]|uniref:Uncharacterized protein n=1 Tax=Lasiosphaeris hirsuta TaxID=260670 RepID=A0AA40BB65_9PEZI|nr:hypothetical protein B0H67DRAFT_57727 [Lasiosphaeris hirsuta]